MIGEKDTENVYFFEILILITDETVIIFYLLKVVAQFYPEYALNNRLQMEQTFLPSAS